MSVLVNLASFTILLLTPYYLGNILGMTAGGIGVMMALAFVGGTAGAPLAARLAPRIGRRPTAFAGIVVMALVHHARSARPMPPHRSPRWPRCCSSRAWPTACSSWPIPIS